LFHAQHNILSRTPKQNVGADGRWQEKGAAHGRADIPRGTITRAVRRLCAPMQPCTSRRHTPSSPGDRGTP
jgi:hypothetical protein